MSAAHDPLQLPLDGIRVVEANAGTGKTFTIAALYLRLILEKALKPEEIAVATFTRAATAELSGRLRTWLALADRQLHDDEPDRPREGEQGEAAVVRRIIAQARERLAQSAEMDARETLRVHARAALLAIDTAQISTLHGFCLRVLSEFGFDAGAALRRPEPIEDLRALDLEIARDFWRRGSGDVATAEWLATTWSDPEKLALQIGDPRWNNLPEDFDPRPRVPDTSAAEAELANLRVQIAAWDDAALRDADKVLGTAFSHPSARTPRHKALRKLRDWARAAADPAGDRTAFGEAQRFDRDACATLGSFCSHPEGPLFESVRALHALMGELLFAREEARAVPVANLLCDARDFLERERARRLAERGLMGHDQAVRNLRAALTGDGAARIAGAIRQRWKAALIDEFQDTDTAQWDVVHALFGDTMLVLVGDPKQAVYGFRGGDVFAWRKATASACDAPLTLATSYRSGARLCTAINALFRSEHAFNDANIDYHDVAASERSTRCAVLRGGAPLPGLECWSFTAAELGQADGKAAAKERARAALEQRTVRYIAAMLASATLRRGNGSEVPLQPKHVAVLVNDNREAASLQAALGEAGIPACSNLRASVYSSEEAGDLALLLEALAEPADAGRARAAWASRLIGRSAADIAATLAGDDGAPQRESAEWSVEVHRHGVLAWLHGLVATAAPRLLELPDGPRRVSNYLQLAELLQDDYMACFGPADLAARFARRRAQSDRDADADSARLRLDTDADAVTVATVHAAKGLEYDVVILPYAGFAKDPSRNGKGVALNWYHDDAGDARVALGKANAEAQRRARGEGLAEEVRKLYVAITRARALCVLPWGRINDAEHAALFHLLHGAGGAEKLPFDEAGCAAALATLCGRAPGAIGIVKWDDIPAAARWQAPSPVAVAIEPRKFERTCLDRDWTVWSFSRLVRGGHNAAADTLPGAGDGDIGGLGGARFGSAVHAVFERTDFAAWRDTEDVPASLRPLIERALADHGLPGRGTALPQAVAAVTGMLRDALNAPLPCGARLADIAPGARRAEIEFHLSLAPADTARLYTLLHAHGYQPLRAGVAAKRLAGLMTGKIDLTFRHDGRYYIVDWKTNRCPPYDATTLQAEIARHDYDLQWIIYTLALHRWLRKTLADYDYERDFGGVYYLFVRGMQDGRGVHVDRPPRALIDALDALLPAQYREAA